MTDQIIHIRIITADPGTVHDCSRFIAGLARQVDNVSMHVREITDEAPPEPVCDRAARSAIHELAMALMLLTDDLYTDEKPAMTAVHEFHERAQALRSQMETGGA